MKLYRCIQIEDIQICFDVATDEFFSEEAVVEMALTYDEHKIDQQILDIGDSGSDNISSSRPVMMLNRYGILSFVVCTTEIIF